ncbi:MAG: hypothetical protein IMF09_11145 [Proteobacteria bacterium]|nr:hypothetical protein [Pseudomonadota bacterium]
MNNNPKQCASAPGKLVLIGEYAVTKGLPALSMAVNRRAVACRCESTDNRHSLHTSMFPGKIFYFNKKHENFYWKVTPPRQVQEFIEHLPWPDTQNSGPGVQLELDTHGFFQHDIKQKTGIGSSAALMLAASTVLKADNDCAQTSHHLLQQQTGSGIDLATSRHGGLICFQRQQAVKELNLPGDFYWQAVWTGESAETRVFLQAFNVWIENQPKSWKIRQQQAASLIAEAITAVGKGNGLALTACIRAYGEWMRELGESINQPIYTPVYEKIREITLYSDCAWKPSGAGGGDIGLICANSRHNLQEISHRISDAGYKLLDLELEPDGLQLFNH